MSTINLPDNFTKSVPDGDHFERDVCTTCGFISYANPKLVAGSVTAAGDGRILLCKRAIEPRSGFWTLPDILWMEAHNKATNEIREKLND